MKLSFTLWILLLAATHSYGQTIVYVAEGGTGNGSSWANATGDLRTAMANAGPSSTEIWVKQGTYKPLTCAGACNPSERATSFELKPGVQVIGGFVGSETAASQAQASNLTILSGDIGDIGVKEDNSYNVVFADQVGTQAGMRNLTITDGFADLAGTGTDDRFGSGGPA